jgi:hypothetical protein
MTTRPAANVAGVALALALVLTGCGIVDDGAGADATSSPGPSPAELLKRGAERIDDGPYSFQFRNVNTIGVGAVDGQNGWLRIRRVGEGVGTAHLTFEVLHADGQYLARSDPLTADQWTRVDIKKVDRARRRLLVEFSDPGRASDLFTGIVSAEEANELHFRGTLDLTKVADPAASRLVDRNHFRSLSTDKAASVPFEATLDRQGRLLGFQLTVPASGGQPEQRAEITYSQHGFKPDLSAPFRGRIGPAPQSVYDVLNE